MVIISLWQGEQVYSVKWYKGGLEIFRNLPSVKEEPITAFPRTGVIIDEVKLQNTLKIYFDDIRHSPDDETSPSPDHNAQ